MVLAIPQNGTVASLLSLAGKTAIVTGGAGGIGREVVRALGECGANVALFYNSSPVAVQAAADLAKELGVTIKAYKCPITDQAQVDAAVGEVIKDFGGVDIMIANAGIADWTPALECSAETFRKVMAVNVDGAFYCAQAAAKHFKETGKHGSVIFTASVSATIVNVPQKQAAYNASKAGMVMLAKCLAVEWADFARVNCVSPGYIRTEMIGEANPDWSAQWTRSIPGGRFAEPFELKGIYAFLASAASSYVTGADYIIDGGITLP